MSTQYVRWGDTEEETESVHDGVDALGRHPERPDLIDRATVKGVQGLQSRMVRRVDLQVKVTHQGHWNVVD